MSGNRQSTRPSAGGYRLACSRNSVLLKNLACRPQFRCLLPLVDNWMRVDVCDEPLTDESD